MPSRTYRRLLRNWGFTFSSTPVIIGNPYSNGSSRVGNGNGIARYNISINGIKTINNIEDDINTIIDSITEKIEFDKIISMASALDDILKDKQKTLDLICNIETTILSIINNVADRVDLNIVLRRIEYVKDLINQLEPTCCISYDGPISIAILEIIDMFSKLVDMDVICNSITNVNKTLQDNIKNQEYIKTAEELLLSILQNISDNVYYGIIIRRVESFQELIKKIDEKCIFYNPKYSNEILDIIILLSSPKLFSDNIIETVCKKIEALHSDIFKQVRCMEMIQESEQLLCSILQNISDRVDLSIVLRRIDYFKENLTKIKSL
jgi:hypothetical protein